MVRRPISPKQRHFDSCFTATELAALDEFHQFYDVRVDKLPESQGTVRTWLDSPVWREVMEQARGRLNEFPHSSEDDLNPLLHDAAGPYRDVDRSGVGLLNEGEQGM